MVSNVLHCNVGDLAAVTGSFTAVVTAPTTIATCQTLNNTAFTTASNAAQQSDPGSITCQTPVLTINKLADGVKSHTYKAGDPITFTVTFGNSGPGTAVNVTLTDTLPNNAGSSINWAISGSPSCTGRSKSGSRRQLLDHGRAAHPGRSAASRET